MDIQLILALIFFSFLGIFLLIKRKKLTTQGYFPLVYFSMYKTKLGLKSMNKLAKKFPRTLKFLSYTGVGIGFIGMGLISFELIKNIFRLFSEPEIAAQSVGLVLPFPVKGGFYVPFTYWIISIIILAAVHEYSHGVIARLHKIKIKSSGFAFLSVLLPIVPAAFVEPDEKQMEKKKKRKQMAVFAAGPFSNIILGFLCLGILVFALGPISNTAYINSGVQITGFMGNNSYPAEMSGMNINEIIVAVDNHKITTVENFTSYLGTKSSGEKINVKTNASQYSILLAENPNDASKGYMGVNVGQYSVVNQDFRAKYGNFAISAIEWVVGLFFWLYLLNLGIGLFNLVPLGPVDGGRMLKLLLLNYFDDKKATKIWSNISMVFLIIILINVFAGFLF